MNRPTTLAVEHVHLQVKDMPSTARFYGEILGLPEIAREEDTIYFGCGRDRTFDLAISEGAPGIDHFALRVQDSRVINEFKDELESSNVAFRMVDGEDPGQKDAVRFLLPSGVPVELVVVENDEYPHDDEVAFPTRFSDAPVALDHVNIMSPGIREDVDFLNNILGMHTSEIVGTKEDWELVFVRCNEQHHDVALGSVTPDEPPGLHHIAWKYRGIEGMKTLIDRLTQNDVEIERGLGRHFAGNNLYCYFRSPGGNRQEILAEMAIVHTSDPNFIEDYQLASVAWGDSAPESFGDYSDVVGEIDPNNG